ncbi:hypothetical protein ACSLOE_31050, partial [Escherichia coli]
MKGKQLHRYDTSRSAPLLTALCFQDAFNHLDNSFRFDTNLITEPAAPDIVPMKRGTPDEPAKQIQTFTREELESIADNEG